MMKKSKFWAFAAATALVLSACSDTGDEIPTPSVETPSTSATDTESPEEDATITEGDGQSQRADQVLEAIAASLDQAYEERTTENILERINGPARQVIEAEFANAERFGIEDLSPVPLTDADSTWSTSADFPRVAMVFTQNPDTGSNDQLVVLSQANGRSNYKLWGYADLVPAEVDITFATDTDAIPGDSAEGLATSPLQAITEYAERLRGDDTNVTFEDDALSSSLQAQRDSIAESLGETGNVTIDARALNHGPLSMATEDGGAVTMGALEYDVVIDRTTAGSTITVGDELARWMTGEADSTYDVQGTLTSTYYVTVAFYIPARGEGNVHVIATADPVLTNVTDDASTNPDETTE
ncbi:LptM family lipoprotein [Flaviflexus massiliensis]|uniref:LptM family lipoprotein n=1 Tax=Flaviflexus massiliensis TaxID=1522309 RepID=UPI0006D55BF3|nr:hypothetical protein [Flaviflexus massiliensis]